MNAIKTLRTLLSGLALFVLAGLLVTALAQQEHQEHHGKPGEQERPMMEQRGMGAQQGPGMGRGMMGGEMGSMMGGMMQDREPMMGRGMGMMRDKCPCPMMGQGMGMMHGMGPMMGMMHGLGPIGMLELSDEQRAEIRKIRSELRRQHWEDIGKMLDEMETLHELYTTDPRDPAAIGEAHERLFNLKRPMIESAVEAGNRIQALLTEEQREQLKQMRGKMRMGSMRGMGMMDPMGMDMED